MVFYTFNNLLLLLWAWLFCVRKPSKNKKICFVIVAFTQLFLVMALRTQIGYDYNMYTIGFQQMNAEGFTSLTYRDWEIGFVVLTKLLGNNTLCQSVHILHGDELFKADDSSFTDDACMVFYKEKQVCMVFDNHTFCVDISPDDFICFACLFFDKNAAQDERIDCIWLFYIVVLYVV